MADKKNSQVIGAGMVGAAVGVAVGAAAVAFSDPKTRKGAFKKVEKLHKQTMGTMGDLKTKILDHTGKMTQSQSSTSARTTHAKKPSVKVN